jgi:hypothetical protein
MKGELRGEVFCSMTRTVIDRDICFSDLFENSNRKDGEKADKLLGKIKKIPDHADSETCIEKLSLGSKNVSTTILVIDLSIQMSNSYQLACSM